MPVFSYVVGAYTQLCLLPDLSETKHSRPWSCSSKSLRNTLRPW